MVDIPGNQQIIGSVPAPLGVSPIWTGTPGVLQKLAAILEDPSGEPLDVPTTNRQTATRLPRRQA